MSKNIRCNILLLGKNYKLINLKNGTFYSNNQSNYNIVIICNNGL